MSSVPVIDLSGASPRQLTDQLGAALTQAGPGFAILRNHGIAKSLLRQAARVTAELFQRSDEDLKQYERLPDRAVGYGPFGCERAKGSKVMNLMRFWHVRRPWPAVEPLNLWPSEDFQRYIGALYASLDSLSFRLADALDPALGFARGTLRGMMTGGPSLLRIPHYPLLTGAEPMDALRAAPHEDINFFTLLPAGTTPGLEVKDPHTQQWVAVGEDQDDVVMNSADMLQMLTQHQLPEHRARSTTHQVVNPPGTANTDRYSWPFFVHPRPDVVLDEATGFTAGQFLEQRLRAIYGSAYEE